MAVNIANSNGFEKTGRSVGGGGEVRHVGPREQPYVYILDGVYPIRMISLDEQQLETRRAQAASQNESLQRNLRERLPTVYLLVHIVLLVLAGLACISLEIVLIVYKASAYYQIGGGIWGGVQCILIAIFCFLLVIKRSYKWYMISLLVSVLGILVLFAGLVVLNILALIEYNKCQQSAYFGMGNERGSMVCKQLQQSMHYQPGGGPPSFVFLNVAMLALGSLVFVLCVIYFVVVPVSVQTDACVRSSRRTGVSTTTPIPTNVGFVV